MKVSLKGLNPEIHRNPGVKVLSFHLILFKYHLFTFKYTHPILFKAQEYLCLAIFEKPMIQVRGKTILSMEFKSIIKANDLHPWQFIYPKAQFTLAISKAQFSLAISKPNSHWQHQNSILIGKIKTQFSLAISKPNSHWRYFVKKEPKIINTWQRKNIMAKYYHGKNHGNRLIKKLIGSYLENYVLIL